MYGRDAQKRPRRALAAVQRLCIAGPLGNGQDPEALRREQDRSSVRPGRTELERSEVGS
jgi:hypothetical protein